MAFISPASRASGAKARRISTRLTVSSTASPPASATTRPFAGWIISTMPAPSSTAALGTNSRQNSGMNGDPAGGVDDRSPCTVLNLAPLVAAGPADGGRESSNLRRVRAHTGVMAPECEVLVLDHRRLARRLAQRYVRHGESREDLEQVAYLGLVKAARRFDPDRGVAFTTFAMPTILGELRRFCRDTRWSAHVPRAMQERVQALRRVEDAQPGPRPERRRGRRAARLVRGGGAGDAAGGGQPESAVARRRTLPDGGEALIEALGREDTGFERAERRDELQRALAELTPREQLRAAPARRGGTARRRRSRVTWDSRRRRPAGSSAARRPGSASCLAGEPGGAPEPIVRLVQADPELFAGLDAAALARARHGRGASADGRAGRVGRPQGERPAAGGPRRPAAQRHAGARRAGRARRRDPAASVGRARADRARVLDQPRSCRPFAPGRRPSRRCWRACRDASDALAAQLAITDQRRVDDRLLSLFRTLGERWGPRTAEGDRDHRCR